MVADLLEKHHTKAWVNFPRRMFSFYSDLKDLLLDSKRIDYSVMGGQWGLACNSVHFIDNFIMIAGLADFQLSTSELDKIIHKSKRSGYIEFTGTIKGTTAVAKSFSLTSVNGSSEPPIIRINTDKYVIEIRESQKEIQIRNINGTITTKAIQLPFQSQLTGTLVEQILFSGKSQLTCYSASMEAHLRFLKPVLDFYNSLTGETTNFCPIT
jgi:hypothetical protein